MRARIVVEANSGTTQTFYSFAPETVAPSFDLDQIVGLVSFEHELPRRVLALSRCASRSLIGSLRMAVGA